MTRGSHISLFAGVGMIDLAAKAYGFETVATAEIDPFCRRVLAARFPDALHFGSVENVRYGDGPWEQRIQRPLLISGGFPCQGVSASGARQGMSDARTGLWSEFARVIHEFHPEYVLIENSPMLRARGMDRVLSDLADLNYDAKWDCIPAAAVGAPHLRDRIFIMATPAVLRDDIFTDPEKKPGYLGFAVTSGCWQPGGATMGRLTTLPRAGRMESAVLFEDVPRFPLAGLRSRATWPTPRHHPNEWRTTRNAPTHGNGHGKTLPGEVNDRERAAGRVPGNPSESAGNMNPTWVEWLMGLPLHWTDPNATVTLRPKLWAQEPPGVPRTASDVYERRNRLKALGNGCVPLCAMTALRELSDLR